MTRIAHNKKPNEVHVLEGTARSSRGTNVLVTIDGELSSPPTLFDMENGVNRDEIFEMLSSFVLRVTGPAKIDTLMLSQIVDQYELYGNAKRLIQENGLLTEAGKLSPYVAVMNNSLTNCHKLMREFGLTPATRGSVKASNQLKNDPFDNIMKGPK